MSKPLKLRRGMVKDEEEIVRTGNASDIVIPVIGKTGVGRSTFINTLLDKPEFMKTSDLLESCTSTISYASVDGHYISTHHPRLAGRRVLLVDTPGFNDTNMDNVEVLRRIGVWLASSYHVGMKLGGVVYLHDIRDTLRGWEVMKMTGLLRGLVGEGEVMKRVVLATTMWDGETGLQEKEENEGQLKDKWWRDMIREDTGQGATVARFHRSRDGARKILDAILHEVGECGAGHEELKAIRIQKQMVDRRMKIKHTDAARALTRGLPVQRHRVRRRVISIMGKFNVVLFS